MAFESREVERWVLAVRPLDVIARTTLLLSLCQVRFAMHGSKRGPCVELVAIVPSERAFPAIRGKIQIRRRHC